MFRPSKRMARMTLAALLGLGASVAANLPVSAQEKPDVLTIGSTAPGHLKYILALDKGWFASEFETDGIAIEQVVFDGGGSEAITALATGSLDVAYTGYAPALRAAAKGADVKLVGLSSFVPSVDISVVVRSDSSINTVEDLKGKKVAFLHGTVRHATLVKALELGHLTIDDIEALNLNFDSSSPALVRGDIDAIVETTNTAQRLVEAGAARVLVDGRDHPEWAAPNVISVNGEFARTHPDLLKRLLKADRELAQWADANYEETVRIFVDRTRSSEQVVRDTYRERRFYQDPRITPEALEALRGQADFMLKAGLIDGPVNFDRWADPSFIDRAVDQVGG